MFRRLRESLSSVLRISFPPFSAFSAPSASSAVKRDAAIALLAIATAGCPSAPKQVVYDRGEAELSLQWTVPAPRAAILDLAPFRGVRAQSFELRVNGQPAGRVV